MKNLLTLALLFAISTAVIGQEAKSTFLTKMEVKWMNAEVNDLQQSYDIINNAVQQKDGVEVSENKTDIIKSVTTLTSNSRIFYNKMIMDIDKQEIAKSRVSDTPPDYYYNKRKNDPKSQEIKISQTTLESFKTTLESMEKIKKNLKETQFALHPQQEMTQKNLESIERFIKLANKNNQIIQSSIRS